MTVKDIVNFHKLDPQHVLANLDEVLLRMDRPRCTGRVLALNSLENRVYLVGLEDGSEVVTKFYRPGRWTAPQILEEHVFLGAAAENEIPVVMPLETLDDRKTLHETPQGILFTLFPKVRGRLTCELTLTQAEILGRYLGRLHALGRTMPLRHRPPLDLANFGDDPLDDIERCIPVKSPQMMRYLMVAEDFLDLVEPILRGPLEERAQTVHGDCHVGNILWDGEAPFLLDFDDLTTCLPVQDLWLIAPGRGEDSQETRDSLLRGYSDFADFHDDDFNCVEALRGLRMIHYVAWIARRWQDPIFPATFINFATDRYWQEECQALMDAAETIQGSY